MAPEDLCLFTVRRVGSGGGPRVGPTGKPLQDQMGGLVLSAVTQWSLCRANLTKENPVRGKTCTWGVGDSLPGEPPRGFLMKGAGRRCSPWVPRPGGATSALPPAGSLQCPVEKLGAFLLREHLSLDLGPRPKPKMTFHLEIFYLLHICKDSFIK